MAYDDLSGVARHALSCWYAWRPKVHKSVMSRLACQRLYSI